VDEDIVHVQPRRRFRIPGLPAFEARKRERMVRPNSVVFNHVARCFPDEVVALCSAKAASGQSQSRGQT
jgi:hypothetical protein